MMPFRLISNEHDAKNPYEVAIKFLLGEVALKFYCS